MPPVWKARLRFAGVMTALLTAGVVAVDLTDGAEATGLRGPKLWLGAAVMIFTVAVVTLTVLIRPYMVDARGSYNRYQASLIREAVADVRSAAGVPDGVPLTKEQRRLLRETLVARRRAARLLGRSRPPAS